MAQHNPIPNTLKGLATGGDRLQRWIRDESKRAGEPVEIDFYDDDHNSFYLLCTSELGMYRVAENWRRNMRLSRLDLFFSENLKKWVVAVELNRPI